MTQSLRPTRHAIRTLTVLAAFLDTLIVLSANAQPAEPSDFVAIVHPSNQVASLSTADMRDLFLANQKKWSGGLAVHPILPESRSIAIEHLLKHILLMNSEADLSMHYMAAIFQQKIREPPKSGSHKTSMIVVGRNPGAIAFVRRSNASGQNSIRIVEIDGL